MKQQTTSEATVNDNGSTEQNKEHTLDTWNYIVTILMSVSLGAQLTLFMLILRLVRDGFQLGIEGMYYLIGFMVCSIGAAACTVIWSILNKLDTEKARGV